MNISCFLILRKLLNNFLRIKNINQFIYQNINNFFKKYYLIFLKMVLYYKQVRFEQQLKSLIDGEKRILNLI